MKNRRLYLRGEIPSCFVKQEVKYLCMIETDFLRDPADAEVRLHEEHFGLLDPIARKYSTGGDRIPSACACNIDRVEVDAVAQLLHLELFPIMLPQIGAARSAQAEEGEDTGVSNAAARRSMSSWNTTCRHRNLAW